MFLLCIKIFHTNNIIKYEGEQAYEWTIDIINNIKEEQHRMNEIEKENERQLQLEIEQNIIKNKMNKMIKKQKVLNAKMKSLSLQNKKRLKSAESNNQVNFFICNYFFE